MTPAQCNSASSVPGAVIRNVTVSGSCSASAANVTFENVTLTNGGQFDLNDGSVVLNSRARQFTAWGKDNWRVENSVFDGQAQDSSIEIWDSGSTQVPENWVIRGNTIKNYHGPDCNTHGEGLFIGYAKNGLIEGNHFENNGCTSHIFFSYWGTAASQGASPSTTASRSVCVRGNTFGPRFSITYFDVNFRSEIPSDANIRIQRDASSTDPEFYGDC